MLVTPHSRIIAHCVYQVSTFWRQLPPPLQLEVARTASLQVSVRNETIFTPGEPALRVFIILTGRVGVRSSAPRRSPLVRSQSTLRRGCSPGPDHSFSAASVKSPGSWQGGPITGSFRERDRRGGSVQSFRSRDERG